MHIPQGYKLDQEGKYYAQIIGEMPMSVEDADILFEDGYQVLSIDFKDMGFFWGKQQWVVSLSKWREMAKCGS